MKSLIYSGIGLFAVATAFGLVDYYGAKKSGTMQQLYKDNVTGEMTTPVKQIQPPEEIQTIAVAKKEKPGEPSKTISLNKASKKGKTKTSYVPAISSEEILVDPASLTASMPIESKGISKGEITVTDTSGNPKLEKEKFALRPEMFSRAPLKKVRRK